MGQGFFQRNRTNMSQSESRRGYASTRRAATNPSFTPPNNLFGEHDEDKGDLEYDEIPDSQDTDMDDDVQNAGRTASPTGSDESDATERGASMSNTVSQGSEPRVETTASEDRDDDDKDEQEGEEESEISASQDTDMGGYEED